MSSDKKRSLSIQNRIHETRFFNVVEKLIPFVYIEKGIKSCWFEVS